MRFTNDNEKKLFLMEIERTDMIDQVSEHFSPDEEMLDEFLKRRSSLISPLKNFRRSQRTKQQWRKDRYAMLKGIKRFHRSTTGKKFHRALGRFIATRLYDRDGFGLTKERAKERQGANESYSDLHEVIEVLQGLSSLKTHAFVEMEFYHPLTEEIEYRMFMEELLPFLERLEKKLWLGSFDFTDEDEEFLCRVVSEKAICNSISLHEKIDFAIVENYWEEIKKDFAKKSYTEEHTEYTKFLFKNLKAMIDLHKTGNSK